MAVQTEVVSTTQYRVECDAESCSKVALLEAHPQTTLIAPPGWVIRMSFALDDQATDGGLATVAQVLYFHSPTCEHSWLHDHDR